MSKDGKVNKFHQFVRLERGPVNTAVIDLLKGQVYQVKNITIDALVQHRYDEIAEFMESAKKEDLIIEIDGRDWLPPCGEIPETVDMDFIEKEFFIELQVEDGINLEMILDKLKYHNIYKIVFYGQHLPQITHQAKIEKKERDFEKCCSKVCMNGELEPISELIYNFNKENNSCWGGKVAVTKDGKVRPCIYSNIVMGDIQSEDIDIILEKLQTYWHITKDKVEKCKDCELKYVCFDCREIPYRESGDLHAANHTCKYDPYNGTWNR